MKKLLSFISIILGSCSLYSSTTEQKSILNYLNDKTFTYAKNGINYIYQFQNDGNKLLYTENSIIENLFMTSSSMERVANNRLQMRIRYSLEGSSLPKKLIIVDYYEKTSSNPQHYAVHDDDQLLDLKE